MRAVVSAFLAVCLFLAMAPATPAQPRQVLQGTQVRLTLLSTINTNAARDGDPFIAEVAEPVYLGGQLLIPAGTRVRGVIGTVNKARRFSMFRGGAYVNISFQSLEIDSRLIPVQMSIISIQQPSDRSNGKRRKDVRIEEGQVVEAKHDIKGDILAGTIGTGGGTLVGAVFSHAARGFGLGLAGSAIYVVARKGKEVELPSQTSLMVRMDNTITVPQTVASNGGYTTSRP
jgi:hypothetical protein